MTDQKPSRREELLAIAACLFAERGFKNTTVRDIADAAGIISGSLYHHFDSKEAIVDEILDTFQRSLWTQYDAIAGSDSSPREKLEAVVRASFDAIHHNHNEVAIYQAEASHLAAFGRFAYLEERNAQLRDLWIGLLTEGMSSGDFRTDMDVVLVYRFLRDTIWVAVRWYRPDGDLSPEQIADQYLHILLGGIARFKK